MSWQSCVRATNRQSNPWKKNFLFRFFVEKLAETDILANLRSEFCISKGAGLYEHQRYCDLYLQCNEQGVGVTMECSRMFNQLKSFVFQQDLFFTT